MKNFKFTLLYVIFFALILAGNLNCKGQENSGGLSLHYLVREPLPESKKPPIIIMLHGWGSDEQDLFSIAPNLPSEYIVVSARAPYKKQEGGYSWYKLDFINGAPVYNAEEAEKSRVLLVKFIDEIVKRYHADPKRVFLMGFSQGAIMTLNMVLLQPEKIHGAIILSGRPMTESMMRISNSESLTQVKVFMAHGNQDHVLDVQGSRDAKALLEMKAVQIEYHEYPMGHQISEVEITDLNRWLKSIK